MNIVISADDFGRSPQRNQAIDKAFKDGMIKSAGLILSPKYAADAVKMARKGGYLSDIHPHFCLASGEQVTGGMKPLSSEMLNCDKFCKNEEFLSTVYLKYDYPKFTDCFYAELEKQYHMFQEITEKQGNIEHVDFHLYGNLSFPVAAAYRKLVKKYNIKSVRYIGIHHIKNPESFKHFVAYAVISRTLNGHRGEIAHSCNMDYFFTRFSELKGITNIELYCHPEMVNGEVVDNTASVFGHEKKSLCENYTQLCSYISDEDKILSWRELTNNHYM